MLKAHRILLKTTSEIESIFLSWCGAARWVYNYGLERKISDYKERNRSPYSYSLMKEIVALKRLEEYSCLAEIPATVPRMALLQLESAYSNFLGVLEVERKIKAPQDSKVGSEVHYPSTWHRIQSL